MAWNGSATMIATTMFSRSSEILRRWLLPAVLLAAAPKCVLCLLAYAGVGAALGLGGSEMCGATDSVALPAGLTLTGVLAAAAYIVCRFSRRPVAIRR